MALSDFVLRRRSRAVWHDPVRTVLTLESFARTEADGGRDIGSAAQKVADPELKKHLERHTAEELKHAELFRRRAAELRAQIDALPAATSADDRAYDLTRGRPSTEVDAHGFFTLGLLDELGEVAYVAMLHAAEVRAAKLFKMHHDLTRHDPPTCAIFEEILRDEHYHVAYTKATLERWEKEGRAREVAAARSGASGNRLWGAWKRVGVRAGGNFGRFVLGLMYWTVLLPFGLGARRSRTPGGFAGAPATPGDLRAQY